MAYPTNSLAKTLEDVDRDMLQLKAFCQRHKARMAAGDVPSSLILDDLYVVLRQVRSRLASVATTPGLVAYAKEQKSDVTLDVVAEFQAVLSAIDGATQWVVSNFPKDGEGFLLARTLGADGAVDRQFNTAQTATLRGRLDNIINAIA